MCVGPVCDFRALICLEDLKSRLNRVIKKLENKMFIVLENEFRILLLQIFTKKLAVRLIISDVIFGRKFVMIIGKQTSYWSKADFFSVYQLKK